VRTEKLRFTKPHLASDMFAITTKTKHRIKGWEVIDKAASVVAVAKGTLHEPVMKDRLKAAPLLVLDTPCCWAVSKSGQPGSPADQQ